MVQDDPQPQPLGFLTRTAFGFGGACTGIETRALSAFLLIFYHQAIGLSPVLISLAITIAMVADAFADPLIGFASDRLRSRLGRRHAFIYASAIPFPLAFFLLWNPPAAWDEFALFAYLLGCLLAVRIADTLFDLPSAALIPELAPGYDERTKLISARTFFRTAGSLGLTIGALYLFLPEARGGVANREGHVGLSIAMAVVMFAAIVTSGAATHRFISTLRKSTLSPAPALSAAVKTLLVFARSRATRTMIIAGMLTAIVMAMRAGLDLYMLLYFWGFAHPQIVLLTIVSAAGALAGAVLAPRISIVIGKKRAAIAAYSLSLINAVAPIMLKLAGLMPPNGSPALLTSMSAVAAATGLLFVVTSVLMSSMLADVADEIAANSGERVEGALFSIDQFFSKAISGLGVLLSAWLLTVAASAFHPAAVSAEQMMRLAAWYAPLQVIVTVGAIMALARYPLGEAEHTANVNRIANRARG